jgi:hypothetical protein
MRYSHLAPAHNLAAVEKLSEYNRLERAAKQQEANGSAILSKHAAETKPTDTPVDTGEKSTPRIASENVQ